LSNPAVADMFMRIVIISFDMVLKVLEFVDIADKITYFLKAKMIWFFGR